MKKILILSFILVLMLSTINVVKASSASLDIVTSSNKVKPGSTFTITLVGKAENNISALQANLSYDKNHIEIENSSVETGFIDFSENNEISVVSTENANLSKETTLYTIIFKVLDTAKPSKLTIKLENIALGTIKSDNTQEAIPLDEENINITIEKIDSTILDKDSNNEKLPQTGIESFSFISIIVLVAIAFVCYFKYRKT